MNETIANRIQAIIDEKSLKKVAFARILNIDQSYVTRLISGANKPSERLIEDICEKLNVNEGWLRTGEGEMFLAFGREEAIVEWAAKITRNDYKNDFVKRFSEMLTKLDESDWLVLEKMASLLSQTRHTKD